jgi:hypothetical protein
MDVGPSFTMGFDVYTAQIVIQGLTCVNGISVFLAAQFYAHHSRLGFNVYDAYRSFQFGPDLVRRAK